MSMIASNAEQRVVLRDVRWETFVALSRESDHAGGRMFYDQGVLEIMSPSMLHENSGSLIGRMIERFTEIRNIEIRTAASTTFRRGDLERGFEADESYYIQHAAAVRSKREIDLEIDPPPDLVVEVDITTSSINKLRVFGSMEIPEVWRYDGQDLWIGCRQPDGSYQERQVSEVLPGFPVEAARQLLAEQLNSSETELIRKFVEAVELHL